MINYSYKEYVSEVNLMKILNHKGKVLLKAPTGGGKTYAIIKTFKELSNKNSNYIYVIACPNRSQNLQNAEQYKIYAIVGGKQIQDFDIASMVYDKAKQLQEYAIKKRKEIILIIDEAHEMIDSENYRKKALKELKELEEKCNTVIHITATPRKLLDRNKYDFIYNIEPLETRCNIKNHILIQLDNKIVKSQLIEFLKKIKTQENKTPYIALNSLNDIKICKNILEKSNYKVGIASSQTKDNDIFKSLEKTELLPTKDYDFIFGTSVLECGANLQNKDIIYINCILEAKQLDFDKIEQKTARPRQKIETAYTLIAEREPKKLRCKESIFKEIEFQVKKFQKTYQEVFNLFINNLGYEEAVKQMESILNLEQNKVLFHSSLYIEDDKILINEDVLIRKKYQAYDMQFYYDLKEFNKELKKRIKAENFAIFKIKDISTNDTKDNIKEINKEMQEAKEESTNKAREILKSLKDNLHLLEEFINDNDILSLLDKDIQEKFKYLSEEEKILKLLKNILKENIPIEEGINIIIKSKKNVEIKDYIRLHNYVMRNKNNMIDINTKDEYGIYRSVFDEILMKKGRVTNKKLEELLNDLIDKKILKTKRELSKANANKLMKTLKMIYNLTPKIIKNKEYFYISSLRKNI